MRVLPPIRKSNSHRRGASAVEFALVAPLFLALILGTVEFGRAIMVGQLVTNAAREGARLAIIAGSTNAQVEAAVVDNLQRTLGIVDNSVGVSVDFTVDPDAGHPSAGDEVANALSRDICTVEVRVSQELVKYNRLTYLVSSDYVARSSMRHE